MMGVSMAANSMLIRTTKLSRIYNTDEYETHAVAEVDLEIRRGEYVTIEGPSGCGKSTLLTLLGLLDEATSGEYRLADVPVSDIDAEERARLRNREIGFVFQSFNLIPEMTVTENVALPLLYCPSKGGKAERDAVAEAIERVGLGARARHRPSQLSGGQQQRVAVARALVMRPSLILADEPTGNLDQSNGDRLMDLFDALHRDGATLITVTHNAQYAARAARHLHMLDGRIVDRGVAP
jgi:putative ABC transport system ATP-binding protein